MLYYKIFRQIFKYKCDIISTGSSSISKLNLNRGTLTALDTDRSVYVYYLDHAAKFSSVPIERFKVEKAAEFIIRAHANDDNKYIFTYLEKWRFTMKPIKYNKTSISLDEVIFSRSNMKFCCMSKQDNQTYVYFHNARYFFRYEIEKKTLIKFKNVLESLYLIEVHSNEIFVALPNMIRVYAISYEEKMISKKTAIETKTNVKLIKYCEKASQLVVVDSMGALKLFKKKDQGYVSIDYCPSIGNIHLIAVSNTKPYVAIVSYGKTLTVMNLNNFNQTLVVNNAHECEIDQVEFEDNHICCSSTRSSKIMHYTIF